MLKKGNVFDTLMVEKHKPHRFLMKEFNEIEEVERITFGNQSEHLHSRSVDEVRS